MKLRLKCPACDYKFIVNARLSSDTGNATCPRTDCNKVFEWRGPDAPLKKMKTVADNNVIDTFNQLFGGIFDKKK